MTIDAFYILGSGGLEAIPARRGHTVFVEIWPVLHRFMQNMNRLITKPSLESAQKSFSGGRVE